MTWVVLALAVLMSGCASRPTGSDSPPAMASAASGSELPEIALSAPPAGVRDQFISKDGSRQIGYERKLRYGVSEAGQEGPPPELGTWLDDEAGRFWTTLVRSDSAVALRLHVDFQPDAAGQLLAWEYQQDQKNRQVLDLSAPFPADIWTQAAEGDTIVVEYRPPEGTTEDTPLPFRLDRVSHMWALP